jgi:dolichyldiphosphatase
VALLNAALAKVLKQLLALPRPKRSRKDSFGMPSSHANSLFFFVSFLSAGAFARRLDFGLKIFLVTTLYAFTICYVRVKLTEDHSIKQIVVGILMGGSIGLYTYYAFLPFFEYLLGG